MTFEIVAIVGSRDFGANLQTEAARRVVLSIVASLAPGTTVISGGAGGVDRWATRAAEAAGLIRIEVLAAWKRADGTTDRGAGMKRNLVIAELCTRLIAVRKAAILPSPGTDHVVAAVRKLGKPAEVVTS